MTGICGWYQPSPLQSDVDAGILEMAKCLSDFGGHQKKEIGGNYAVFGKETITGNLAFSTDRSVLVLLSGRCWLDTDARQVLNKPAEVVCSLYSKEGPQFLARLKGTFALVIIDQRKHVVMLAIDRYGVKPLTYIDRGSEGIVFGSTATSVAAHPDVSIEIDDQAVYNYVYFHVIPAPRTIYRSIKKLPPAHYALWQQGHLEVRSYWRPEFSPARKPDFSELKSELQVTLSKAVSRQVKPGYTGAYLSGGIDSSTVSGLLARYEHPADAYSIGFDDEAYNEIEYARIAAKHFGLNLHEYFVTTDDVLNVMPKIAQSYDEPFGNSSVIPAYFCAMIARESGKSVMLGGDAGDELFGGNERYVTQAIFGYYNILPAFIRRLVLEPLMANNVWPDKFVVTRKLKSYILQARVPMPDRLQTYNFLHRVGVRDVFTDSFLVRVDPGEPIKECRNIYESVNADSMLDRMLYLDWKITLADNDIRKVSRMGELAGVEVRYPFLDDDLVQFSTRVPPNLKIRNRYLRYFFKRAMNDFLPREIIKKSKHGFGLPFGVWLKKSVKLQEFIYANLDALKKRDIIRPDYITRITEAHRGEHAGYYGTMVWVLAVLELWLQAHFDK